MTDHTDRLGLGKPVDDSTDWGGDYRAAMDALDAHPGVRVVWVLSEVTDPWVGQVVFETSTAKLWGWSGLEWAQTGGPPAPVSYRHVQGVAASVWVITHNLGYYPGGITVKDSGGDLHEGEVTYTDINTLSISFFVAGAPAAFAGEAYLS